MMMQSSGGSSCVQLVLRFPPPSGRFSRRKPRICVGSAAPYSSVPSVARDQQHSRKPWLAGWGAVDGRGPGSQPNKLLSVLLFLGPARARVPNSRRVVVVSTAALGAEARAVDCAHQMCLSVVVHHTRK